MSDTEEIKSEFIHVVSSNLPANGIVSYNSGFSILNFNIGQQDRVLYPSTLRLNFKLKIMKPDGTKADQTDMVGIEPCMGAHAILEQLTFTAKQTNQTIEQIEHYNRFLSSYFKSFNDKQDFFTSKSMSSLAGNSGGASSFVLNSYDADAEQDGSMDVSIPLISGLMSSSNNLPLSSQYGIGGLLIQLNLANDSNVLYDITGGDDAVGFYYEMTDVHISAEVGNPTKKQLSRFMKYPKINYNSISSYNTTLNSSYATINFNLGLSRVLKAFVNIIKSNKLNSYENGLSTDGIPSTNVDSSNLVKINKIEFLKGGILSPLNYEIRDNNDNQELQDSQIMRNFINSIDDYGDPNSKNILNLISLSRNQTRTTGVGVENLPGQAFGIGINYDKISNDGVDFSGVQFGLNISSDFSIDEPQTVYLFVQSRQQIMYGPQGIKVNK